MSVTIFLWHSPHDDATVAVLRTALESYARLPAAGASPCWRAAK